MDKYDEYLKTMIKALSEGKRISASDHQKEWELSVDPMNKECALSKMLSELESAGMMKIIRSQMGCIESAAIKFAGEKTLEALSRNEVYAELLSYLQAETPSLSVDYIHDLILRIRKNELCLGSMMRNKKSR